MNCRFCNCPRLRTFANLGMQPLSNAYVKEEDLSKGEKFYPLHALVCTNCFLVQLEEFESPTEIFSDYAYFSSQSQSWLDHCKDYVNLVTSRFGLREGSKVLEIASNDGYLLQFFPKKIEVLGIEPAANVAEQAWEKDIPTLVQFFDEELADVLDYKADLIIANNVLAHTPQLNSFVAGLKKALNREGVITCEFPHLKKLIDDNQFDTIYHEHFSYFSFSTIARIFAAHDLWIFDVEELPTHGGSLRIYACHLDDASHGDRAARWSRRIKVFNDEGYEYSNVDFYHQFQNKIDVYKNDLLEILSDLKENDKSIVCYGAPAKLNTLLNYCGIKHDFIDYVVDSTPYKQGRYLPGSRIPIYDPGKIEETKPDVVWITPWNWAEEILNKLNYDWNPQIMVRLNVTSIV